MNDGAENLGALIRAIEREVGAAEAGLPEELFLFVSRITPLVNVDLLVEDDRSRTLLTWRSDSFYGPGWHIPGGIVRYKETAAQRIVAVARRELGAQVEFDRTPLLVHETIKPGARDRAHFISMLYRCRLVTPLDARQRFSASAPLPGQWSWHDRCPEDLIPEHRPFAALIGRSSRAAPLR